MATKPVLPAVDQALDVDLMLPLVAQAAGRQAEKGIAFACPPEVLNYKPGRRCTILYTLTRGTGSKSGERSSVVAKLYNSRRRALRSYERTGALRSSGPRGCGVPCIPTCLAPLPSLGLFFQEYVEGAELDHVAASAGVAPFELAAQWLARLHASPRLEGLRELSHQHDLKKVDAWSADIENRLAPLAVMELPAVHDGLRELSSAQPAHPSTMIHRDFYHAQVLWTGERVWVLDFDELSVGDPILDVGHFLAHLAYKAHLVPAHADAFETCAEAFLDAYRKASSFDPEPRLGRHTAYTFLKLAHTEVIRQKAEWQPHTQVLLGLARSELEASSRRGTG